MSSGQKIKFTPRMGTVIQATFLLLLIAVARSSGEVSGDTRSSQYLHEGCVPECGQGGTGALSKVHLTPTALYSFPGSGNTWVRHLLTTATGILTGVTCHSVDDIRVENDTARRVIVVKTHLKPQDAWAIAPTNRTIILIRNPYDALLAEFNRLGEYKNKDDKYHARKTGVRPIEDFGKEWDEFIYRFRRWEDKNLQWAYDNAPTHVLVFHRLQANLDQELNAVFNFLNESTVVPRMHCLLKDPEGTVHREKPDWLPKVAVFSKSQTKAINDAIDFVQRALESKTGKRFQDFQQWKR